MWQFDLDGVVINTVCSVLTGQDDASEKHHCELMTESIFHSCWAPCSSVSDGIISEEHLRIGMFA